ncbi:MAG: tetratricopeptide repeat protein [Marinicellaceae bacterium]
MKFKHTIFIFTILIFSTLALYFGFKSTNNDQIKDVSYHRGVNAYKAKEFILAQKYFEEDLLKRPKNAESLYKAAQSFMKGKYQNFNKSVIYYKRYLELYPKNPPLNLKLIQELNNVGMKEELIQLTKKTKNELYLTAIWEILDTKKALEHLEKVPNYLKDIDYYLMATRIYSLHQNHKEVVFNANKSIELSGLHQISYYYLSQAHRNLKNFAKAKKAIQAFELIKSINSEKTVSTQLITMHQLLELNITPKSSADFNAFYISLLINTNNLNEAEIKLNLIQLSNLNPDILTTLILSIQSSKAYQLANKLYNNTERVYRAEDMILFCKIEVLARNEVVGACEKAFQMFPQSAPILYLYGTSLIKNNNDNTIPQNLIQRAINFAPWMDAWIIQLANLYLLDGKVDLAKKVIKESIKKSPELNKFKLANSLF